MVHLVTNLFRLSVECHGNWYIRHWLIWLEYRLPMKRLLMIQELPTDDSVQGRPCS